MNGFASLPIKVSLGRRQERDARTVEERAGEVVGQSIAHMGGDEGGGQRGTAISRTTAIQARRRSAVLLPPAPSFSVSLLLSNVPVSASRR